MSSSKKGTRLGTQLRGKLQQGYQQRGKSRYSLWYVYSPKARRDFVLHGDLRYGHFLQVESDPDVHFVDYAPHPRLASLIGDELSDCIDAEIRLVDGTVVWRCIRSEATAGKVSSAIANLQLLISQRALKGLPARIETFTEQEVYAQPQRIQNWSRLIPWVAQAREWPLHEFGNEVAVLLHTHGEVLLQDVMALGEAEQQGLYIAALLQGVQFGHFASDLNDRPFSLLTRFYPPTRGAT